MLTKRAFASSDNKREYCSLVDGIQRHLSLVQGKNLCHLHLWTKCRTHSLCRKKHAVCYQRELRTWPLHLSSSRKLSRDRVIVLQSVCSGRKLVAWPWDKIHERVWSHPRLLRSILEDDIARPSPSRACTCTWRWKSHRPSKPTIVDTLSKWKYHLESQYTARIWGLVCYSDCDSVCCASGKYSLHYYRHCLLLKKILQEKITSRS